MQQQFQGLCNCLITPSNSVTAPGQSHVSLALYAERPWGTEGDVPGVSSPCTWWGRVSAGASATHAARYSASAKKWAGKGRDPVGTTSTVPDLTAPGGAVPPTVPAPYCAPPPPPPRRLRIRGGSRACGGSSDVRRCGGRGRSGCRSGSPAVRLPALPGARPLSRCGAMFRMVMPTAVRI